MIFPKCTRVVAAREMRGREKEGEGGRRNSERREGGEAENEPQKQMDNGDLVDRDRQTHSERERERERPTEGERGSDLGLGFRV